MPDTLDSLGPQQQDGSIYRDRHGFQHRYTDGEWRFRLTTQAAWRKTLWWMIEHPLGPYTREPAQKEETQ